jgi:flagellar M-ring protein FliF
MFDYALCENPQGEKGFMIERLNLEQLGRNLLALGPRRLAILAGTGVVLMLMIGLASYLLSEPEYETLYSRLDRDDVTAISAALASANIPTKVSEDSTSLLVPGSYVIRSRALLAEQGLPSGTNSGYELFDNLGSVGLTSFMQEVTRIRALEGEIARTIQALRGVKASRVHLVMPNPGSFRRKSEKPSASVVVNIAPSEAFEKADAIRYMVAGAVPGLTPNEVTVLSIGGRVLAAAGDENNLAPSKLLELERVSGTEIQTSIRETLAPYLGIDNFRISATVRLNTDKHKIKATSYDPEKRVERSVKVVKEKSALDNSSTQESVSVEQNVPQEAGSASPGDKSSEQKERREELTNYEIDTKVTDTLSEGYKIEKIFIAVVVNRERITAILGQGATPDAIDTRVRELENLISSAVGINTERGDQIKVSAVDFLKTDETLQTIEGPGFLETLQGHVATLVKSVTFLAAVFLLIWFGIRPVTSALKSLPESSQPVLAVEGPDWQEELLKSGEGLLEGGGAFPQGETNLIADVAEQRGHGPQKKIEQLIDLDEKQAASVLKKWVKREQPV